MKKFSNWRSKNQAFSNNSLVPLLHEETNQTDTLPSSSSSSTPTSFSNQFESNEFQFPKVVWPFRNAPGAPFVHGYLNRKEQTVEVFDCSAIVLFHLYGCFGSESCLRDIFRINYEKSNRLSRASFFFGDSDWTSIDDQQRKRLLQLQSYFQLNPRRQNTFELINALYPNALPYDAQSCPLANLNYEMPTSPSLAQLANRLESIMSGQFSNEFVMKLDLEEAFYLTHALGMFNIHLTMQANRLFHPKQVWSEFCRLKSVSCALGFEVTYAAYYFFRSKGYVVKSGHKYGCHFMLYTSSPSTSHSLYAVKVRKQEFGSKCKSRLSDLTNFERSIKAVKKTPIVCIVKMPQVIDEEERQFVWFIRKMRIQLISLNKWDPSQSNESN